jgi:hypothetical protein
MKPMMAKGESSDLVKEAAGLPSEDEGEEYEDETEDGGKAEFMRMAKAIKAGDFEEAWTAYKACTGAE